MKFKGYKDINKPQSLVAELFANPKYLGEYQEGFIRKELISGTESQDGAVSKMYYTHGSHEMELTETITVNNLPDTFEAHYHHIHMDNTMKCSFIALDANTTRYEYEFEYTRINWIMPKLMAILFPSAYKKPAEKWMNNFKEFVEKQ
ncbi:SRPBCC family protein [Aquimarina sp. 2201CG14-23]|uniref:SRPBCC family protein n=1 Tax=Aquimarina mycalae TaxID=3040073 RepID=UPI002477F822|nr:SRPBCC family protein [Aquimarina sp. 2201CG14-23]MDH7447168.1 SRPBCC family protein [Aquimarina sp. 2201CG14-23]